MALLLPQLSLADDAAARPVGSWRLVSFQVKAVGEDAPPRDVFGSRPFGRLILTPARTMAAFISKPDRKPPASETEAAALLSTMVAYTGKFRLEGDKFITVVMAPGTKSTKPASRSAFSRWTAACSASGPPKCQVACCPARWRSARWFGSGRNKATPSARVKRRPIADAMPGAAQTGQGVAVIPSNHAAARPA